MAWSSRWIDGSATFTTVLSSMIMNSAKHIAPSVHHLRLSSVRRIRSGITGSPSGQKFCDVIALSHHGERGCELRALARVEAVHELPELGEADVDQARHELVGLLGGAYALDPAVFLVLGAGYETAVYEAIHGAADRRHREPERIPELLDGHLRGLVGGEELNRLELRQRQAELIDHLQHAALGAAGLEDIVEKCREIPDQLIGRNSLLRRSG